MEKVEGSQGNFKVTLKKTPRYIDEAKCTACGDCAVVCPVELPNEYDQGLSSTRAIYRKYAQAILEHLDEKKITQRVGDDRIPGPNFKKWRDRT